MTAADAAEPSGPWVVRRATGRKEGAILLNVETDEYSSDIYPSDGEALAVANARNRLAAP